MAGGGTMLCYPPTFGILTGIGDGVPDHAVRDLVGGVLGFRGTPFSHLPAHTWDSAMPRITDEGNGPSIQTLR